MHIKLFETLPFSFFQIFSSSSSREMYADILYLLYFECEQENSYTFLKEDFVNTIETYIISHRIDDILEFKDKKNARDKANIVFRRLKECGWIDTEFGVNGEQHVNFEDYAIAFLNTFVHFESDSDIELSSYIYRIFQNIKHIDPERMYFVLRDCLNQADDLIDKLRSLNSNIKKYIKKVTSFSNKSEEEQLKSILDQLLNDYKMRIIDNAYFYMKTHDNPVKYKTKFIESCEDIHYDYFKAKVVITQIMEEDRIDEKMATEKFEMIMNDLESVFDKFISIIDEIDKKNSKYINVAIEKVRILMNNNSDLEGRLLHILKNHSLLNEEDMIFSLSENRNIINNSLYTPRKKIKVKSSVVERKSIDKEKIDSTLMDNLKLSRQYSRKSIKRFVDDLLRRNGRVTIDSFNLRENSDLIKLILIFVYSESNGNNYKIKWLDDDSVVGNIHVPNFIIERKNINE